MSNKYAWLDPNTPKSDREKYVNFCIQAETARLLYEISHEDKYKRLAHTILGDEVFISCPAEDVDTLIKELMEILGA